MTQMNISEGHSTHRAPATALFDWQPDIDRLEREVEEACRSGRGDPLTMGEIECSIDLIDAELLALRGGAPDPETKSAILALQMQRTRLARLAVQLRPRVPDY